MNARPFFEAVYARPADDGAKQVLADVLQELGDPRGDFIALQMQARRSRKAELKLERLLERHRLDFLGPLASAVSARGQVWEKGFLVECRATLEGKLVDEPSWATVRALELLNRDGEVPRELWGPHFRALQTLGAVPRQAVLPLFVGERSLPLRTLSLEGPGNIEVWNPDELDAVRTARSLPDLRHLTLSLWRFAVDELEWLWTAPVFGRLRVMELAMHRVAVNLGTVRDRLLACDDVPDALVLRGRQLEVKLKPEGSWGTMQLSVRTPLVEPVIHDAQLMLQSIPANALLRLDVTCDYPVERDALANLKSLVKRFPRLAPVSWPVASR